MPQNWFFAAPAPEPVSTVFETNDCIWYHGTIYVKEAVAVARMQQMDQMQQMQQLQQMDQLQQMEQLQQIQEPTQITEANHYVDVVADDDDDTESISSGNGSISAFKHPRNIGKQNQLKYLNDGMLLRHVIQLKDEWFATFDAETNRIIRSPDGVAFDTLRQFARLHCNEVDPGSSHSTNVWSDPHFQYQDDTDGQWHPLANLKK